MYKCATQNSDTTGKPPRGQRVGGASWPSDQDRCNVHWACTVRNSRSRLQLQLPQHKAQVLIRFRLGCDSMSYRRSTKKLHVTPNRPLDKHADEPKLLFLLFRVTYAASFLDIRITRMKGSFF